LTLLPARVSSERRPSLILVAIGRISACLTHISLVALPPVEPTNADILPPAAAALVRERGDETGEREGR
jgi:hypothetical protein